MTVCYLRSVLDVRRFPLAPLAGRRDRVARDARRTAAIAPRLRPLYLARRSASRRAADVVRRDFAAGVPLEVSFARFMAAAAPGWRAPVALPKRP